MTKMEKNALITHSSTSEERRPASSWPAAMTRKAFVPCSTPVRPGPLRTVVASADPEAPARRSLQTMSGGGAMASTPTRRRFQ